MDRHELIDAHLAALDRRLPKNTVEELADGLIESWHAHLAVGHAPNAAAQAAVDEFGDPDEINTAFVAHSPGRRASRRLLITGPLVGASWVATFVATRAWTWPVPTLAVATLGLVLVAAVTALMAAATSAHNYRLIQVGGAIGGAGVIAVDSALLTSLALVSPEAVWPLGVASTASLIRIAVALRLLRSIRMV